MAKEKKGAVKYYRLRRPFFNGKKHCEAGTVQPFPEGKQPSGATLVTAEELKAEAVMQETAQDVFITSEVQKYIDSVLPELVEEAVTTALEELDLGVSPGPVTPPPDSTK